MVTSGSYNVGTSARTNDNLFVVRGDGSVGIGTITPAAKLDVNGDGRVTGIFTGYSTRLGNYGGGHANIYPANNADIYFSNNSGNPLMMIDADSTGNVGIGTTAPVGKLHIYQNEPTLILHDDGWSSGLGMWRMHVANSNGKFGLQWNTAGAGDFSTAVEAISVLPNGNVGIGTTSPGSALHVNTNGTANETRLSIGTGYQDTTNDNGMHFYAYSDNNNYIDSKVGTNGKTYYRTGHGTEGGAARNWMTVDGATGNVGIGTTSPSGRLHVNGGVYFQGLSGASSGYYLCQDSGTNQVTRGGSCSLSDIRLKRDIAPLPNALSAISTLRGVSFRWKDPTRSSMDGSQIGLIAQDVEKVYPQAVVNNQDGTKGLNYDALMGPMVEAIKELKTANEQLQQRVRTLEGLRGEHK